MNVTERGTHHSTLKQIREIFEREPQVCFILVFYYFFFQSVGLIGCLKKQQQNQVPTLFVCTMVLILGDSVSLL